MSNVLQNEKCSIEFKPDKKEIFATDRTDLHNMPAAYNKTRRGIKKAWAALELAWSQQTTPMTMYDCLHILHQHGIRCHTWCMMD